MDKHQPHVGYKEKGIKIDDDICRMWARLIERISAETTMRIITNMRIEKYTEVAILSVDSDNNTARCKDLVTGEILNNVPNYSGMDLVTLNEEGTAIRTSTRGRMFVTNVSDNPQYLGVLYD